MADEVKNINIDLSERMREMIGGFVVAMPEKLADVEKAADKLRADPSNLGAVGECKFQVHKLTGVTATFGLIDLADVGRRLEVLFDAILENNLTVTSAQSDQIESLLDELRELGGRIDQVGALNVLRDRDERMSRPLKGEMKLVYLVAHNTVFVEDMGDQLGHFGYKVLRIETIQPLEEELVEGNKTAVIIDTGIFTEWPQIIPALADLKERYDQRLCVIFVSKRDDFDVRLNAVRAGGSAFFQMPVDIPRLIAKIEALTAADEKKPFSVLIVDDDPEQAAYYAFLLQEAGMVANVVIHPRQVIRVLIEAKPELVLIDMYMPECSGLEIASIIRQQEAFVSIPIVFLSSETKPEKQLKAMQLGGDDYLTIPISSERLTVTVATRVERSRSLRYFMERDSLTGLLNHTNLSETLQHELKRAVRTNTQLCFVMIDIDHFKSVNDTYGHLIGDKVLKSLARLLQERLRKTDLIGRYGGEEFAVVLINIRLDDARRIMDEIRTSFAQIRHQAEERDFFVTFSCGIAHYPTIENTALLSDTADKALYEAKRKGRNRTIVHSVEYT